MRKGFTSVTGKAANRKIQRRHTWTPEEARRWAQVAVQMRLLNGTSSNQHLKKRQ